MLALVVLLALLWTPPITADPSFTVYVNSNSRPGGDGTSAHPFALIADAVTAGLNEPPSTTTWTIRLQEGVYAGTGQVGIAIRDTKRYIVWFENRGVHVQCQRAEFFLDFTGLGGRGALEVAGNGGSISECSDSAIRSRRQLAVSSLTFLRNRALLQGSALRVLASDVSVDVRISDCIFEGQLQRPVAAPSSKDDEGGGAVWVSGAASVSIMDCSFMGNEASQGGGAYIVGVPTVNIGRSTFRTNTALLDTVGGGGLTLISRIAMSMVSIFDTVFEFNNAGGLAAGVYLGGLMKVNMTRVRVANNTSLKKFASSCDSCDTGVGVVLWKKVLGSAVNCSFTGNVLDEVPSHPRNLACMGPIFARSSSLRWNDGCDVCGRDMDGAELPLTPALAPCRLPMDIWNSAIFLYGMFVVGSLFILSVLAGGGYWVWRRYRHRDNYANIRHVAKLTSDMSAEEAVSDEVDGVEMRAFPLHHVNGGTVSAFDGLGASAVSAHDFDDNVEEDQGEADGTLLLEPPGYGKPLPSQDFVRHSPAVGGTFKEIDYDELDLEPEPIGSGAFGLVYRATWRGSVVAVKKYIGTLDAAGVKDFRAEAQLLHGVGNHPNVIKLFGACTQGPNYCLVLPYFRRGSVREFFRTMPEEKRTWAFVRSLALQIVAGMIHLHRENVIHRDLAARNILVDDNDTVRITDFGLARFIQNSVSANTNSNMGAVAWMAPEAVTKRRYGAKSDVWSFGCTLWEMCTGELPFAGMEPIHVAVQIAKGATLAVPDYVPADLAATMRACWAPLPADRPSFEGLFTMLSAGNTAVKSSRTSPHPATSRPLSPNSESSSSDFETPQSPPSVRSTPTRLSPPRAPSDRKRKVSQDASSRPSSTASSSIRRSADNALRKSSATGNSVRTTPPHRK